MELSKLIILPTLLLTIVSCGGGGGEGSDSGSTTAPPPPVSSVADFPITEENRELVRYAPNHYIKYEINGTDRETATYKASTFAGTYSINYSFSSDPSVFGEDAIETLTKSHTVIIDGQAMSYTEEAIQLPEDWDETPSSSERIYREMSDGNESILGYVKEDDGSYGNYGQLSMPGSPYIGYHFTENVLKEERISSTKAYRYDVFYELNINAIETIQTALGTFEAYVVELTYTETKTSGVVSSTVGKYWLHPAIGYIKAELTESVGQLVSESEVTDYEYIITNTNIQY